MSNIDEFCRKLDDFGKNVPDILDKAQLSIMKSLETYIVLESPLWPEAAYSTGEYRDSHVVMKSGNIMTIMPNTDHDIEVEEGAEGGWWPVTSGYRVYTKASLVLKNYAKADLMALARKKTDNNL